ncbi:MAG: T9SS type A sorting domain-containing protein [Candidatus Coatesbacteria bacterium]|nr:MAG: T9SS type A sorting domain-containing protein [Candidatus Coatesbacteria bacterium]
MRYLALIMVGGLVAAAAGALFLPEAPPTEEERLFTPHLYDGPKGLSDAPAVPHNYDVKEYVINVTLDDVTKEISGHCAVAATSMKEGLREVQFNFENDVTVSRVTHAGQRLPFKHAGAVLTVTFPTAKARNQDFKVIVYYRGKPQDGLYFTSKGVYVTSAMEEAQHWFPCYDLPDDKADRVELTVTCRDDWYVAGNGLLTQEKNNGNGTKTFTWVTQNRIATYLISISGAYKYSRFGTRWSGIPINYYVFPEHRASAEICFEHLPQMMQFFSDKFWRYPFDDERYGIAEAEMAYFGGMENQTCISADQSYIRPNHSSDNFLAHELGHMWWGDCISPGSWKDLWLNEGHGTYCDALWEEHAKGEAAYRARMQYFASRYFAEDQQNRFPVYNPTYPWSATVYQKGAWIMHMLRYLLGEEKFFRAWNQYGRDHEFGHAFTVELQQAMEKEYGKSLQEFFDDWVYKAGYPEYEFDWTASGNDVTVKICQVQTQTPLTPLFDMPVELTITTQNNQTRVERVWVRNRFHRFRFSYGSPVTNVEFDKDGWILCKKANIIGIPVASFDGHAVRGGVKLAWRTNAGAKVAGFNLFREGAADDSRRLRLNDELITGRSPYAYVDRDFVPEEKYRYWLETVGLGGKRETFGPVECRAGSRAHAFALAQNFPNPARGVTTVAFTLPAAAEAKVTLYDVAGRKVRTVDTAGREGENDLAVDVAGLAPGVYTYRLEAGGEAAARKMVVAE